MNDQQFPDFDALWDHNNLAETERKFRELLPVAQSSGDRAYHAQLLTQIARAAGLQRKFEEAHRTLDEAEALLAGNAERARIRYLLERGRVYNSSREQDRARPLFLDAWERGLAAEEDALAVDAAHMLAIVAPPHEQMEWNLRAMALAERSEDPHARKWLGSLYNNIGWSYHDAGEYQQALDLFRKALAFREAEGRPVETRIARWCVARALRSLQRSEEALQIQAALLEELAGSGETDGYVYEELGECLLLLGREDEARPHFARAYEVLSQDPWLMENEPARVARLQELGGV